MTLIFYHGKIHKNDMGKKSRKKRFKKPRLIRPDDILSFGPFSIARYGRHIVMSNNANQEEHARLLEYSAQQAEKCKDEWKAEISKLQNLISKLDPLELMHRSAYEVMPLFLKYKSEADYSDNEAIGLPGLEYLQYLIARTRKAKLQVKPDEEAWNEVWSSIKKVFRQGQQYLFFRKTKESPPSSIDELRYFLDNKRLGIRVEGYSYFLPQYWEDSLRPYENYIKVIYNIDVNTFISGLQKLQEFQKHALIERYENFRKKTEALACNLAKAGYKIDSSATPEEIKQTQMAMLSPAFKDAHSETMVSYENAFTTKLFDVTEVSGLPIEILTLFSVKPEESILTDFDSNDDISPLSISSLHYKPFIEVNGRFYHFLHSGFEDKLTEIIEDDLFSKMPTKAGNIIKLRSERLEMNALDLLKKILCPEMIFKNLYYPDPNNSKGQAELDGLIVVDDLLFLIECKAGGMSESAKRGAPDSLTKDISNLIIEGQRQAERAEKYIKCKEEVDFYDSSGKTSQCKIQIKNFRRIFRIVVTKEPLGWVGAQIANLSILEPSLSSSPPWHVSIVDLQVVSDIFEGLSLQFVHYLEQRLIAAKKTDLQQYDEIDHLALYLSLNVYHSGHPLEGKEMSMITYGGYAKKIDIYYADKYADQNSKKPVQELPKNFGSLIQGFSNSKLKGRFEAASFLLNMDRQGRDDIEKSLIHLDSRVAQQKIPSVRIPLKESFQGLSITFANGELFDNELLQLAAHLKRSGFKSWLVVQILKESNDYQVRKIQKIISGDYSDDQILVEQKKFDEKLLANIGRNEVGRNDPCPCGSGKKWKKCHGK
ncbi:MAG: SEC-C metal-binding domain-containing protein [Candidatus Moranbacteria bacterium]|nr:SEC-C metal-binding domain-containing protein [Candidatus Moranbacteria bacterium]